MNARIDAVVGVDINPLMGGVSAFNHQLAQRLGVPCVEHWSVDPVYPLVSVKARELSTLISERREPFDLLLHSWDPRIVEVVSRAARVFAASAALADDIRSHRPDVITAHCPGLIHARGAFPSASITVFAFGHGHKLQVERFSKLKELLDATGQTYAIYLSAGLHTGAHVADDPFLALERLFGDRLVFLGILSDRAVAHYLATSTYVACFFDQGVRENNTTVQAALDAGACVITTRDRQTVGALASQVLDIDHLTELPQDDERRELKTWVRTHREPYGWDRLLEIAR